MIMKCNTRTRKFAASSEVHRARPAASEELSRTSEGPASDDVAFEFYYMTCAGWSRGVKDKEEPLDSKDLSQGMRNIIVSLWIARLTNPFSGPRLLTDPSCLHVFEADILVHSPRFAAANVLDGHTYVERSHSFEYVMLSCRDRLRRKESKSVRDWARYIPSLLVNNDGTSERTSCLSARPHCPRVKSGNKTNRSAGHTSLKCLDTQRVDLVFVLHFPILCNLVSATEQPNGWMDSWVDFWIERRLKHMIRLSERNGGVFQNVDKVIEKVCFLSPSSPHPC